MSDIETNDNTRIMKISLDNKKEKKIIEKKPRKKRIITEKNEWNKLIAEFQDFSLLQLIEILENTPDKIKILGNHIRSKIRGYASQDKEKKILDETKFIQYQEILDLLKNSQFHCHYCKEEVILLYEYVREPKQWTLERKNNDYGHNRDNVVLACLTCNLKRRCMNMERYELTKQMSIIEKLDT